MITVIDQPRENLYEGMGFYETLDNMIIGVYEACNDFMMDTLLTEHSYLYENATEITYVNEDGSDNANGASLKEKFFNHVNAIKQMIGDAIKRVLEFISKKVDAIHDKLISLGINEKKIDEAAKYLDSHDNVGVNYKLSGWAFIREEIKEAKDTAFINQGNINSHELYSEQGQLYKELQKKAFESLDNLDADDLKGKITSSSSSIFKFAKTVVLGNSLKKDINEAWKNADKSLESLKKSIGKGDGGENIGERIGRANDALKSNAIVAKDLMKAYVNHFNDYLSIITTLIKVANRGKRDEAVAKAKANIKNSPIVKKASNIKANAKSTIARAAYNANKKNPKFVNSEYSDEYDED
jgi:hypothetical protein